MICGIVVLFGISVGIGMPVSDGHGARPAALPRTAAASASPTAPVRPLDAARVAQFVAGRGSGDAAGVRAVFDVSDAQSLDAASLAALASLGEVRFDLPSFHDNGDGTATVAAHTPAADGVAAEDWSVLLVDRAGTWFISQTDPA